MQVYWILYVLTVADNPDSDSSATFAFIITIVTQGRQFNTPNFNFSTSGERPPK